MPIPKVDRDKCIGCGLCPALAPSTFKIEENDGKARVTNPKGDDQETIQMAIDACPTQAISWDKET